MDFLKFLHSQTADNHQLEAAIMQQLSICPMDVEQLAKALKQPSKDVLQSLLNLRAKNLVAKEDDVLCAGAWMLAGEIRNRMPDPKQLSALQGETVWGRKVI